MWKLERWLRRMWPSSNDTWEKTGPFAVIEVFLNNHTRPSLDSSWGRLPGRDELFLRSSTCIFHQGRHGMNGDNFACQIDALIEIVYRRDILPSGALSVGRFTGRRYFAARFGAGKSPRLLLALSPLSAPPRRIWWSTTRLTP